MTHFASECKQEKKALLLSPCSLLSFVLRLTTVGRFPHQANDQRLTQYAYALCCIAVAIGLSELRTKPGAGGRSRLTASEAVH